MRILTILMVSSLVAWSQGQKPSAPQPTSKPSAETTRSKEISVGDRRAAASDGPMGQSPKPVDNDKSADPKSNEELNLSRKLTTFTGMLVAVGFLQLVALLAQALIFWRTLAENRNLIRAASISADAARDGARAAVESNTLTRTSIEDSQRANLAHEALVKESNALTRDSNEMTLQSVALAE